MLIIFFLLGLVIWIVCLVFNVRISNRKGRKHVAAWVVFSVFFSLIALIINAAVPKRKDEGYKIGDAQSYAQNIQSSAESTTMFCPNCGEEIRKNAKFCPKCGKPVNSGKPA